DVLDEEPCHPLLLNAAVAQHVLDRGSDMHGSVVPDTRGVEVRIVSSKWPIRAQKSRRRTPARRELAPELLESGCIRMNRRSQQPFSLPIEQNRRSSVTEERRDFRAARGEIQTRGVDF